MNVEQLIDKTLEDKDDSLKLHFKLNEVHKSLAQKYNLTANIINLVNFGFKIVASVILVVCFVRAHYIDKVKHTKLEKHQLITYYFKHTLSSSVRSVNSTESDVSTLFNEHKYEEANSYLSNIYTPDKPGILLYMGYANMCIGNYSIAEKQLKEVIAAKSIFAEQAEYYLIGNYILNQDNKKAEVALNNIIEGKGPYAIKSKSLLYYLHKND